MNNGKTEQNRSYPLCLPAFLKPGDASFQTDAGQRTFQRLTAGYVFHGCLLFQTAYAAFTRITGLCAAHRSIISRCLQSYAIIIKGKPESAARAFGLPINDVVGHIPEGRHLICHDRNVLSQERKPNAVWLQIQDKLAETGMMPSGPILQILLTSIMNTHNRVTCGMYVIPLQNAAI